MSVNRSMDYNTFQAHLAGWRPQYPHTHHQYQYQTRPPHVLPSQTMAFQQQSHQQGHPFELTAETHPAQPTFFDQGFHGSSFFDDGITYRPEEATLFNAPVAAQQSYHHQQPQHLNGGVRSFGPSAIDTSVGSSNTIKLETSPQLPSVPVLQQQVDSSQYEAIDDWALASLSPDATSPSSIDSLESGAYTPVTPMGSFDLFEHHMSQLPHGLPTAGSFDQRQMMTGSLQGVQHHGGAMLSTMLPKPAGAGWDPEYGMMKLQPEPPSYRSALPAAPANFGAAFGRGNQLNQADGSEDDDSPMFNFPMEAALRRERDAFLLSMRRKGHSYREIKRRGRFREAESTLRGRVRVLTKDKSQRVRKPEWTDDDVKLLRRAVKRHCQHINDLQHVRVKDLKVPWKTISEWVKEHGGTYLFAPATCARKWEEIRADEEE